MKNNHNHFSPAEFGHYLSGLAGRSFPAYQQLRRVEVCYGPFSLSFRHIQKSPGAEPASVGQLKATKACWPLPDFALASTARQTAVKDFILRAFTEGINSLARQNRGVDGSGSFQAQSLPQQILVRNIVELTATAVYLSFRLSLPANSSNKILAPEAQAMLLEELPAIVEATRKALLDHQRLRIFCATVEDHLCMQERLAGRQLVAFIGDNSRLPRQSGISDLPRLDAAVPFQAPAELAVTLDFPNAGPVRGLGIQAGVTVLIGGGFHGKSTLLNAIARGIYPHIPGDGRERVITVPHSAVVCAEEGRAISKLDLSGLIRALPDGSESGEFSTSNASGSTSTAAALVENICAGAQLLLIDEDCAAANFLHRDQTMGRLLPEDPIIPLFDRVRELYEKNLISTVLIAGGSSVYLGAADQVIAMRYFQPVCMTRQAKALNLPCPGGGQPPLSCSDQRRVLPGNFEPAYENTRLRKQVPIRIKPLRAQEQQLLEYGQDLLDLRKLGTLVDADQLSTIGYALLLARQRVLGKAALSPSRLAAAVLEIIEREGLAALQCANTPPCFFSQIRQLDLAGAINRLRSLKVRKEAI